MSRRSEKPGFRRPGVIRLFRLERNRACLLDQKQTQRVLGAKTSRQHAKRFGPDVFEQRMTTFKSFRVISAHSAGQAATVIWLHTVGCARYDIPWAHFQRSTAPRRTGYRNQRPNSCSSSVRRDGSNVTIFRDRHCCFCVQELIELRKSVQRCVVSCVTFGNTTMV